MNKNKLRTPIKPELVVQDVTASDTYREGQERHEPTGAIFGKAALDLALLETYDSGHRTREGDRLHLAGLVDQFAAAQERLDHVTDGSSRDYVKKLKKQVAEFNHALKALIDNDPGATPDEIKRFVQEVYRVTHAGDLADMGPVAGKNKLRTFGDQVSTRIDAMANEIGTQQLFHALGYDVDADVSPEDELNGIDMFISKPYSPTWGVDTKSSEQGAIKGRTNDTRNRNIIVWSGLSKRDFKGKFRLDTETIARRAPILEGELRFELRRTGRL